MSERKHLIGGTNAATLLGLGRTSPVALYLRLRGEVPDQGPMNLSATKGGRLFEDHVAKVLVKDEMGIELERPEEMTLQLADEPRIGCSFDFKVADSQDYADIKLTGSRKLWGEPGDKVPLHIAAQMQFDMAVARARKKAIPCIHVLAWFLPGWTFEDFPVEEDQAVGEVLLERAHDMIRRVDEGDPPEAGSEADARALFLGHRGESHVCTDEEVALIDQLQELKAASKIAEDQAQQIRDVLLPACGDATELVSPHGEVLASWRSNRVFGSAEFEADYPELAQEYRKRGIDLTRLQKDHKKVKEAYMREPASPAEATRVFRLRKR